MRHSVDAYPEFKVVHKDIGAAFAGDENRLQACGSPASDRALRDLLATLLLESRRDPRDDLLRGSERGGRRGRRASA